MRRRLDTNTRVNSCQAVIREIPHGGNDAGCCLSCGTCTGCDRCYTYCPEHVIHKHNGSYAIELDYCKGCGICFEECPLGIVDMVEEQA